MDAHPKRPPAHVARRRRIVTITGVASATNARAAHHDTAGTYFMRDPNGRHREVEARVLDLVRRCEQFALATWGHAFTLHVRLDDRKSRRRSWGGLYHSRWRTERVDPRSDHDRRGGINIALARRVRLDDPEPFRPGTFHEYTHLSPWGDVGTTSMFAPLDVCVAHEVAHAFAREARGLLCGRLGLFPSDADEPHGRLFAEVYARLRRHLGLIDPARPEWLALAPEARVRALAHTRKALRPEVAVLAVTDPAAYRRQQRAARQRQRREAQRHEQADGTVPAVMNTGMEC